MTTSSKARSWSACATGPTAVRLSSVDARRSALPTQVTRTLRKAKTIQDCLPNHKFAYADETRKGPPELGRPGRVCDRRSESIGLFDDLDDTQREQLALGAWTIGLRAVALRDIESRIEDELSRLEKMEKCSDAIRKNVESI